MAKRRGHGEGSIYQRKDGLWAGAVHVGWVDGKRQRKVLYGRTRGEVAEKMKVALRSQQQGLSLGDDRTTVGAYLDAWLRDVVPVTARPSTLKRHAEIVRLHITPTLGHIKLSKLTAADVEHLLTSKVGSGLSPATVVRIHAVLRAALTRAERLDLVTRNVAARVSPPRVPRKEVKPLTPAEAAQLLDAARGDRLAALYSVAISVGLRQGEALGLHWSDIDLDAGTLRVRTALQRVDGKLTFVEPKSDRSRRTVALPGICVVALREHRVRQLEERLAAGDLWQDHDLVFTTSIGTPIDSRNLIRHFHGLCERAGIGRRNFHSLRHTAASFLLAQGVHARVVMEVLGHSQMSLTTDTYMHVMPLLGRQAADVMDRLLAT